MGGTGAVYFNEIIRPNISLCFCPQSTVSPIFAPFESRYSKYTDKLPHNHIFTDITKSTCSENIFLIYGINNNIDLLHAERLHLSGHKVILVQGCGHDVAAYLKKHGHLPFIIEKATQGSAHVLLDYINQNMEVIDHQYTSQFIQLNSIAFDKGFKNQQKKISAMQMLSKIANRDCNIHFHLGILLRSTGNLEGAKEAQEKAVALAE